MSDKNQTNAEFAANDQAFRNACEKASIAATSRQASKWRMGKGSAYKVKKGG